ncbi:hypothetical protein [Xenorhabdus thuongxuanensis]|uniref:Uncharacterized protein n=1 Tax=Xenorhabdus thuongxuanensis TaxID=1873484 RepID=A0A1Q5TMR4_9GAMM|nr:hypothetical protein [Xenorhabdus thuongxuanensis]OKP01526.1 hypothetical protein Xentx_03399 [Xenorhabdus thuongxuanensis]
MLTKNGSVRGCKKPNSQTLQGATAQVLAAGIRVSEARLPARIMAQQLRKIKGVTSC